MAVQVDRRGAVTVITIDRVAKRNAIDPATTQALDAAFNEFADDESAGVAVLTGGPQVFSAGTDIATWAGPPTERGGPYGIARRELGKPLIAAVEGVAAGGGFEIALAATLIVAVQRRRPSRCRRSSWAWSPSAVGCSGARGRCR